MLSWIQLIDIIIKRELNDQVNLGLIAQVEAKQIFCLAASKKGWLSFTFHPMKQVDNTPEYQNLDQGVITFTPQKSNVDTNNCHV